MYAKLIEITTNGIPYVQITASKNKEYLDNSLVCEYVYKGSLQEEWLIELLETSKVLQLELSEAVLDELSHGFYKKYGNILILK